MLVSPQTTSNIRWSVTESNLTLDSTVCLLPLPSPWVNYTESSKSSVRQIINIACELENKLIMENCSAGAKYNLFLSSFLLLFSSVTVPIQK